MSSFFEKGTLLTGIQRQVLILSLGTYYGFVFINLKNCFRLMGVCAENLGNIFGTDSLTEIVPLRLLAGWREEVNRFPLQFAI